MAPRLATLAVLAAMLGGCAGELAYRNGKRLLAQEELEQGLARLQEAARLEPGRAEYRAAYLQARERVLATLMAQAGRLEAQGDYGKAESPYRRALAIEPHNEAARDGLRRIDAVSRHANMAADAAMLEKRDPEVARAKLADILAENPGHAAARARLRALDERRAQADPAAAIEALYRRPVTLEFRDAPLRRIFDELARASGLNFLFDKDVRTDQRASVFLRDGTVGGALQYLLRTSQLERQVLDGNAILIYPATPAKRKDYQEMVIRTFHLTNADAKAVAAALRGILRARDVVVDDRLNLIIMRDSAENVALAAQLVALHDVAEPEVMLEVEIVEIRRSRLLDLGVRWPDTLTLTPLSTGARGLTLADLRAQNSGTLGAAIGPATVTARQDDGDTTLLANPRIRTRNREKAKIFIGERVPNITTTATATGFVSESVNYVDIGLTLNVEPAVHLDDDVGVRIGLEVNSIAEQLKSPSGAVAYRIGTRTASTVLRLRNGETQVLAGLINDEDRRSGNKVPALGEVPLLGRLFGNGVDDGRKTEIVLAITPRLIRNIERPPAAAQTLRAPSDAAYRGGEAGGSVQVTDAAPGAYAPGAGYTPAQGAGLPPAQGGAPAPAGFPAVQGQPQSAPAPMPSPYRQEGSISRTVERPPLVPVKP